MYLVFFKENGDREDCNTYYSWLVYATSKEGAVNKVASLLDTKPKYLDALRACTPRKLVGSKLDSGQWSYSFQDMPVADVMEFRDE